MVADKIQYPIGQYIAEEIISRINSYGEIDSEHNITDKDIDNLKELKDKGILTEEEYQLKKNKLTDQLLRQ